MGVEVVVVGINCWGVGIIVVARAGSECFGFGDTDGVGDGGTVFGKRPGAGDVGRSVGHAASWAMPGREMRVSQLALLIRASVAVGSYKTEG